MHLRRTGAHRLKADGEILDSSGAPVAHRALADHGGDCGGLARAIGVWASLVLDSELRKANAVAMSQPEDTGAGAGAAGEGRPGGAATAAAGMGSAGPTPAVAPDPGTPAGSDRPSTPGGAEGSRARTDTAGEPPEDRADRDGSPHRDEARALELGAGVFLMTGTGGGALAGPTAFAVVEASHGIFLRPALAYGQSLNSVPGSDVRGATWMTARFDGCLRVPGLYTRRHGMQLDLCGGTEVGFTSIAGGPSTTLPYLDIGPSLDLRGELGSSLSAVVRLVTGINVLRESFVDQNGTTQQVPIATGRLEVAFSWDLQ
jgi:hypothetical protein